MMPSLVNPALPLENDGLVIIHQCAVPEKFAQFHAQRALVYGPVTNQLSFGLQTRATSKDHFLGLGMCGQHIFENKRQCPIVFAPPPTDAIT